VFILYLCVFYKVTQRLHFMQHSALRFPRVWITPPAWQTHSHTLFCWDSQCGWASSSSSFQLTIPVKRTAFPGTSALRETLTHTHTLTERAEWIIPFTNAAFMTLAETLDHNNVVRVCVCVCVCITVLRRYKLCKSQIKVFTSHNLKKNNRTDSFSLIYVDDS